MKLVITFFQGLFVILFSCLVLNKIKNTVEFTLVNNTIFK